MLRPGQDICVDFAGFSLIHHNQPDVSVDWHAHAAHELFLPLTGEIHLELRTGDVLVAGPGKMVYLPPDVEHAFTAAQRQGERLLTIIEPKAWAKASGGIFPPLVANANQLVKELLFYLLLHPEAKSVLSLFDAFAKTLAESLDAAAVAPGAGLRHVAGKIRDPRLLKAWASLQGSFSEDLVMATLARQAGLSTRSLNRLFLAEIGMTPKQAQTILRIERAKEQLTSSALSVTEVAMAVGYSSLSQFIATFRRLTGQLPSDFQHLGEKPRNGG